MAVGDVVARHARVLLCSVFARLRRLGELNIMKNDRFKDYDSEVRQLVLSFENAQRSGNTRYYDEEEMETIIDFYLDTADAAMLERSVRLGERLFPTSSEMRLRRAHLLCVKERFDDALSLLTELHRLEPGNTDVCYALGAVYSALGKPEKSVHYYSIAATDGYEPDTVYCNMADEYMAMERYDDAMLCARRALKANNESNRALLLIGQVYYALGKHSQGSTFFAHYVKEHPYSSEGWYCLGASYFDAGLYEHAEEAYQYAIAIDDGFVDAYEQLAEVYGELGQYDNAAHALHNALQHSNDKSYFNIKLGDLFRRQNNFVSAAVYYRTAIKSDPLDDDAWVALATCYASMNDNDNACDVAERALRKFPQSAHVMVSAAVIFGECNRHDEARTLFEELISLYPEYLLAWVAYADFLLSTEAYDDAIELISHGLTETDCAVVFHVRLAYCCYRTGRRNGLFDAVRACLHDCDDGAQQLLDYYPAFAADIDVMNIITSFENEKKQTNEK